MNDNRSRAQRWADAVTEFSGSWSFIGWFIGLCVVWIIVNAASLIRWDPYPFLFLNWMLMVIGTFQNPLILMSHNRQNETDRDNVVKILSKLEELQKSIDEMKSKS